MSDNLHKIQVIENKMTHAKNDPSKVYWSIKDLSGKLYSVWDESLAIDLIPGKSYTVSVEEQPGKNRTFYTIRGIVGMPLEKKTPPQLSTSKTINDWINVPSPLNTDKPKVPEGVVGNGLSRAATALWAAVLPTSLSRDKALEKVNYALQHIAQIENGPTFTDQDGSEADDDISNGDIPF